MIHAICDFCGKEVDSAGNSYILTLTRFQNKADIHERINPECLTMVHETKGFIICQNCKKERQLPDSNEPYYQLCQQEVGYKKCLNNYTEDDFAKDVVQDLGI